jgi:non-histone protein 10
LTFPRSRRRQRGTKQPCEDVRAEARSDYSSRKLDFPSHQGSKPGSVWNQWPDNLQNVYTALSIRILSIWIPLWVEDRSIDRQLYTLQCLINHIVLMFPANEESKYKQKCKDLKRRIREIETHNETVAISIERAKRSIQRIRLERALLEEKLEERTNVKVQDSEGSPSPPGSPIQHDLIKKHLHPPTKKETRSDTPKAKKPAAPRDPNLPKRPQNAYIIFCDREKDRIRDELEKSNPGGAHDLTRALADAWKALGQKGRKPYYDLYEDGKARYEREMAAFTSPNPGTNTGKTKTAKDAESKVQNDKAGEEPEGIIKREEDMAGHHDNQHQHYDGHDDEMDHDSDNPESVAEPMSERNEEEEQFAENGGHDHSDHELLVDDGSDSPLSDID